MTRIRFERALRTDSADDRDITPSRWAENTDTTIPRLPRNPADWEVGSSPAGGKCFVYLIM